MEKFSNDQVLTFAKRLQKNLKAEYPSQEFKLSKCQEIMSKTCFYRDLHESKEFSKENPESTKIHSLNLYDEKTGESSVILTSNNEMSFQKLDHVLETISPQQMGRVRRKLLLKELLQQASQTDKVEVIHSLLEEMKDLIEIVDSPKGAGKAIPKTTFVFQEPSPEKLEKLEKIEEIYRKEAHDAGLELIGPGKNKGMRQYKWFFSGHIAEYRVLDVRKQIVCDLESRNGPKHKK